MTLDSLSVEHICCSKCGRELTSPEEFAGVAADIDSLVCEDCYQTVLFPDSRDYNCEMMDCTDLPRYLQPPPKK